jgi:hypothetical protein
MPDSSEEMGPAKAVAAPVPPVAEDRLHVVFGTRQVGRVLAAVLAGRGVTVRVVSRHRPPGLADGMDWRAADSADLDAASDAAKGAAVVYQCLNARYTQWPERFPPLQRGVLTAAERTGALLVSLENLYGYGPTGGKPMTEDLPLAATCGCRKTPSPHATCEYSRTRPTSRSRLRTRVLPWAGAAWVLPPGGFWLRVRCGRWVL